MLHSCVPALGTAAPWSGWFSEKPLSRQRPEDRRLTREAREEQRRRIQEEQVKEGKRRKREEEEQRGREAEMKRELEQEHWRERKSLEDQLAAERTARVQSERKMAKEIHRLEAALARIGVPSGPSSGGGSVSLPRTPVTPQGPLVMTPVSERPRTDLAVDIVKSLIGRTTRALEILVSGTDEQRRDLGQIARNAVDTNGQDFHDAQRELFGQELSAEDWDEMSPDERQENLDKFAGRIKQKREERRGGNGTQ